MIRRSHSFDHWSGPARTMLCRCRSMSTIWRPRWPRSAELAACKPAHGSAIGKQVSVIKSVGGVGATALLCQLAIRFAEKKPPPGAKFACIDLDVQFGDAAFQLGLRPNLSLLTCSRPARASTGICCARPRSIIPAVSSSSHRRRHDAAGGVSSEHLIADRRPRGARIWHRLCRLADELDELVAVGAVADRTWCSWSPNWRRQPQSLPPTARPDRKPGSGGARRANRCQPLRERPVQDDQSADVRQALGRDVGYTIANDHAVMCAAVEQGVPIGAIKRKSASARILNRSTPASPRRSGWSAEDVASQEIRSRRAARKLRASATSRSIGWLRSAMPALSPSAIPTPT